ncbi:PREDICTED: putative phosphatidate phosphatase, partial [Rhagoletis zephyria]|uniref:putative phosphatidate phosphatase n=1 Tax=Rhagoletis zephyria TaxID=28612 RepID=UPI0008115B79
FLTDVSKYSIGRLRPHFIDLCRPQLPNGLVMDRFSNCQNPHTYVTEYTCFKDNLSMSSRKMKDVRLSFMSGHSSFAAVCLVYLVLYLHLRMRAAHLALVKHLYQAALLYLVFYTGMSRISDYKHHWSDVLCGLLQGTLVAILVAYFVGDLVKPRSYENMQQITVGQLMSGSSSGGVNGGSSAANGDSSSNGAFKDIHQVESGV